MRLLRAGILIATLGAANAASAGAWLRDKGTAFVSLTYGATQTEETDAALYVEYGFSDATTVGIDVSTFTNAAKARSGTGHVFLRRALGPTDGAHRFAYELGVGGSWGNDEHLPTVRAGLSWGMGFALADSRAGWVNVDASYTHEETRGQHETKLDGTLGLDLTPLTTGILEINIGHQNGKTYGAVEPSLLLRPKGSAFNVKMGAEIPFGDSGETALKLGLWYRY